MMNAKQIVTTLSLLSLFSLLSPAASAIEDIDITAAAQNATTRSDHEAVAAYYEDSAREIQAKAQEQKQLLEEYESKSYLYGRQTQDLQSHTYALVRKYEKEAKTNIKEAALHRQMAANAEENGYSVPQLEKLSIVHELHQATVSKK
ncbi:hypothetical protein [Nitrosospira sp. NRS527]|uniref:hypothetical protein n=1 Tax=Nitrosospira sp. NRS527 TaxID=155925 RepID=UPI001AF08172|nr:hypothetical protein [Nitrosospira sp. NRS527]BCT68291.1 hypothetical protein NNRS527_01887 [Nitrosospira sp. NRS527]